MMDEICKNCGHEFKFHESSGWYSWWCDAPGPCLCDVYIPPNSPVIFKNMIQYEEKKETTEGLDFWRLN